MSWLRELVDVPAGVDELADRLTMCGFEVGAVEPWPADPRTPGAEPDAVLDLEITTNRPDCLSVLGIAREVATAWDAGLRTPAAADAGSDPGAADAIAIAIDDPDLCPRYVGALARVTVGPSPPWLARRLEAADVRPINNVVDVTNYVMLELGHPMHAFDLERLAGPEIRVRRARAGETVRTLDGADRTLDPDMLVIADAERPQAVAGVMGGAASEVGADTRTIVLEAAWFDPISVRRTSRRLGLATDASYRFERGADVAAAARRDSPSPPVARRHRRGNAPRRPRRPLSGPARTRRDTTPTRPARTRARPVHRRGVRGAGARAPRLRADARGGGRRPRLAGPGPDVPGGCQAGRGPDRGSRAPSRLRRDPDHVPGPDPARAGARPLAGPRSSRAPPADRGRLLRGRHLRVRRRGGGPRRPPRCRGRRGPAQPAVGTRRRAPTLADRRASSTR